eukprot:RCo027104
MTTLALELVSRVARLDPPICNVHEHKGVRIPVRDGVLLAAVWLEPTLKASAGNTRLGRDAAELGFPTILIRTPYHKELLQHLGEVFCGYGYHVIVQDVRGRGGSGGSFDPMLNDAWDGQDTILWIRAQPWFQQCPYVGAWGMSFMGLVQHAMICPEDPRRQPDAMVPMQCSAQLYTVLLPDNNFALELYCRWSYFTHHTQDKVPNVLRLFQLVTHPIGHLARLPIGKIHEEIAHSKSSTTPAAALAQFLLPHIHEPPDSAFWSQTDFRPKLPFAPPCHFVGGWYDFFLREVLADYQAVRAAGRQTPYLTIGPWTHFEFGAVTAGIHVGLRWFETLLRQRRRRDRGVIALPGCCATPGPYGLCGPSLGSPTGSYYSSPGPYGAFSSCCATPSGSSLPFTPVTPGSGVPPEPVLPVSVYLMGEHAGWRHLPSWPPCSARVPFYLHRCGCSRYGGGLSRAPPGGPSPPSSYVYDPKHATPSRGGPLFHATKGGRMSNHSLEIRNDVISFTSDPLTSSLEIMGAVHAELYFSSTSPLPDLFVRLCAVTIKMATPVVVCDGLLRVKSCVGKPMPDGTRRVEVDMWSTAFRVAAGQSLRVTVSSAAYPRFLRSANTPNIWTGVTPDTPKSVQWIYHDVTHPSCVVLPVTCGV